MFRLEVSDSASVSASSVVSGRDTDSLVGSWPFFSLCGAEQRALHGHPQVKRLQKERVSMVCSSQRAPGCPCAAPERGLQHTRGE